MDGLEAVGDPVRRRFVELLARGERTAGDLAMLAADEFGITQPAASRHLRVLREAGVVASRVDGQRRVYALEPTGLEDAAAWFDALGTAWEQRLDALGTELARGRRLQRGAAARRGRGTSSQPHDTGKAAS
ncbi:ArsR/SmtB family transcription factor [Leifsonia shinshuensis]|uniref:DNA-binding transcriptional ArsR family regulator n=1 Tax=Leifsonia shinshuensis TaxID=150026 RepID=A0A853CWD0_9MICO|nr:metalloregulator ArsR/SmtB family transcription factor [Leifsonia shinshuensis]NYJ24957.1 DNA-binding transcriptional ArsR family regulator [Leifsonia shinshuensis]